MPANATTSVDRLLSAIYAGCADGERSATECDPFRGHGRESAYAARRTRRSANSGPGRVAARRRSALRPARRSEDLERYQIRYQLAPRVGLEPTTLRL